MPNSGLVIDMLTLLRLPSVGPVRARKLLDALGSPDRVFGASVSRLCDVPGIGPKSARDIASGVERARRAAKTEAERAHAMNARIIVDGDDAYPPLLRDLPGRPMVLSMLGAFDAEDADRFSVGIVGSRKSSVYGQEQAERFGGALASAGLTVVSGGARGIDSAAHRAAVAARGRTAVVLGCGLEHVYPPENRALYDQIVDSGGCVMSELPIDAPPEPGNFPMRNRIISGLSLGVLVVEAGLGSGALITARIAAEEHGREVFALPGRVDSEAIAGNLMLLKTGGAHLVTEPGDVLSLLESPAHHLFRGSHGDRYQSPAAGRPIADKPPAAPTQPAVSRPEPDDPAERAVLGCLGEPATMDELMQRTGLSAADLRRTVTMLELQGWVGRSGAKLARRG
ncbi:MAG: DNA-processing protein DprA [Planctomycetota bacterium]